MEVDEELPIISKAVGSQEIIHFSDTMETLYKVISLVNPAYFAGDLEKAYLY